MEVIGMMFLVAGGAGASFGLAVTSEGDVNPGAVLCG